MNCPTLGLRAALPNLAGPPPPSTACPPRQVPAERVLVVYDDLDLPTAQARLMAGGGAGGRCRGGAPQPSERPRRAADPALPCAACPRRCALQVRLRAKGGHGGHNGMKSIACE